MFEVEVGDWVTLESAPAGVDDGGSIVAADGYLYTLRGGYERDFWRYDLAGGAWESLADALANVSWGGSLAWDGSDSIYALRGSKSNDFWKYSIAGGKWIRLHFTPGNVDGGGALAVLGDYVYAFRGDDTSDLWRYDPREDKWKSMEELLIY